MKTPIENELDLFMKTGEIGSFDNGDPNTTNLYLGNLNPKVCLYCKFNYKCLQCHLMLLGESSLNTTCNSKIFIITIN